MRNTAIDEDDSVLALPALLDLTAAEPLHRLLLDRVRSGDSLVVVGETVERVSTAVVQILLAVASESRARGSSFRLRDPSPVLTAALADLGVASHFGF